MHKALDLCKIFGNYADLAGEYAFGFEKYARAMGAAASRMLGCPDGCSAVQVITRELSADGNERVTTGFRVTYAQQSCAAYNEGQVRERTGDGFFVEVIDYGVEVGRRGDKAFLLRFLDVADASARRVAAMRSNVEWTFSAIAQDCPSIRPLIRGGLLGANG